MRRALILLAIASSIGTFLVGSQPRQAFPPMAERSMFFVEPGFPHVAATAISIL